jgi:hypothetical protein
MTTCVHCDSEAFQAVLRFRHLDYHFLKLGDFAIISVSKVKCRGCLMFKQRVAQKIGNGQVVRPIEVPALMYSTLFRILTFILNSCSVTISEVKAEYIELFTQH